MSTSKFPKPRSLPGKYIAIIFEGSWFFRPDPLDTKRVLGVCPYVDAPDHICEIGLWFDTSSNGIPGIYDPQNGAAGIMQESDRYRVDVSTTKVAQSFDALFSSAHHHYHFPYLKSTEPTAPLKYKLHDRMRQVSISMPSTLEVDGLLTSAKVDGPKQQLISYSASGKAHSYVTFIFVYDRNDDTAEIVLGTNFLKQSVTTSTNAKNHMHFRVSSPDRNDSNGCRRDSSAESSHVINTFDSLRTMVFAPTGAKKPEATHKYCEFGISLPPGQDMEFRRLNTKLSYDEIGIPGPGITFNGMAACGAGPMAGSGDDGVGVTAAAPKQ